MRARPRLCIAGRRQARLIRVPLGCGWVVAGLLRLWLMATHLAREISLVFEREMLVALQLGNVGQLLPHHEQRASEIALAQLRQRPIPA